MLRSCLIVLLLIPLISIGQESISDKRDSLFTKLIADSTGGWFTENNNEISWSYTGNFHLIQNYSPGAYFEENPENTISIKLIIDHGYSEDSIKRLSQRNLKIINPLKQKLTAAFDSINWIVKTNRNMVEERPVYHLRGLGRVYLNPEDYKKLANLIEIPMLYNDDISVYITTTPNFFYKSIYEEDVQQLYHQACDQITSIFQKECQEYYESQWILKE